jgi:hypothetical protein
MGATSLAAIETAFRASFSRELCAEDDLPFWTDENPARGHCAIAALTLNDLLGGELLLARVDRDGQPVGYHYWNRLDGIDIDMTANQFNANERVGDPQVLVRPAGRPTHYGEQYDRFRTRVGEALGIEVRSRSD